MSSACDRVGRRRVGEQIATERVVVVAEEHAFATVAALGDVMG